MKTLFRTLRNQQYKQQYDPLIHITLSASRLKHNLAAFQQIASPARIAPVLKSNAYGHGLLQIASLLEGEEVPFLVVDSYFEALILRNEGIRTPILIIGYTKTTNILSRPLKDVAFTVTSIEQLTELAQQLKQRVAIHIKFDTGMHRQGIPIQDADAVIAVLQTNSHIRVEGICSHFADADNANHAFTERQIQQWNALVKQMHAALGEIPFIHLSATTGGAFKHRINANVMRVGIGLYGIFPSPNLAINLQPVLEMRSIVTGIKQLEPGDRVGYGGTFIAEKPMTVALIPVGYYEGLDRRLSNTGSVLLQGRSCSIVGRISMNMTTVDISRLKNVQLGDEVIVISSDSHHPNSIEQMAKEYTIPYELLVHIPSGIRRTIID